MCVCVCESVCPSLRKGMLSEVKILKKKSPNADPVFLLFDIERHFQGQTFGILFDFRISRKW